MCVAPPDTVRAMTDRREDGDHRQRLLAGHPGDGQHELARRRVREERRRRVCDVLVRGRRPGLVLRGKAAPRSVPTRVLMRGTACGHPHGPEEREPRTEHVAAAVRRVLRWRVRLHAVHRGGAAPGARHRHLRLVGGRRRRVQPDGLRGPLQCRGRQPAQLRPRVLGDRLHQAVHGDRLLQIPGAVDLVQRRCCRGDWHRGQDQRRVQGHRNVVKDGCGPPGRCRGSPGVNNSVRSLWTLLSLYSS
jgi:hypothetical protein